MTETVKFPSTDFPGYLGLSLESPDGWESLPAVGLPLAVAKGVPDGEFRPNVIAVLSRFGAGHTMEQAIEEVVRRLSGLPEYAEIARETSDHLGHPGFRIEGAFSDSGLGSLVQAVRLVLVDRGPVRDLVQVTGSCSGAQIESTLGEIREIQDSLRVHDV